MAEAYVLLHEAFILLLKKKEKKKKVISFRLNYLRFGVYSYICIINA